VQVPTLASMDRRRDQCPFTEGGSRRRQSSSRTGCHRGRGRPVPHEARSPGGEASCARVAMMGPCPARASPSPRASRTDPYRGAPCVRWQPRPCLPAHRTAPCEHHTHRQRIPVAGARLPRTRIAPHRAPSPLLAIPAVGCLARQGRFSRTKPFPKSRAIRTKGISPHSLIIH